MRHRHWLWGLLGLGLLTGVLPATLTAQTGWKLLWSDEFNGPAGTAPDAANWKFEAGLGREVGGNQEAETYCAYGSGQAPCQAKIPNAYLDGKGHLVMVAVRTNETIDIPEKKLRQVPVCTSARLNSLKSFRYGRIEASLRVPTGMGVWPAFWALGIHQQGLNWPAIGEMDIMESWNPQPETGRVDPLLNHASVHGPVSPGSAQGYVEVTGTHSFPQPMQQGFHQFAAEWWPGEVDFFCDGILYSRQSVGSLSGKEVWEMDNAPFYLLLNLAMGGGFFGYPDTTTEPYPTLVVNYVRVYQRDDALLPSGWGNADIGGPDQAGFSVNRKGLWTVAGSGGGIAGHADQFQMAYKALAGDGEIATHVLSQTSKVAQARAGVMLRDGRGAGAPYAMVSLSPDGSVHFRARGSEDDLPGDTVYKGSANWLKVARQGDILTGYASTDGTSWSVVGQARLSLHRDLLAGIVSTARDNGAPNLAQFDHVDLTVSDAAWDGAAAMIPGTIQAELFDVGGEGYSYASSLHHKGTQPFRAEEGPSIHSIATHPEPNVTPGGYYLSELGKDSYLNYSVVIAREGDYILHLRASSDGAGGAVHFNLDQKPVTHSIRIPDTGGAENWQELHTETIHLPAGQHILALVTDATGAHGSAGNVDYFTLSAR